MGWYWKTVSNRREMASCNFTHASCWWQRFWFLAGFNSIYPLEKMTQWRLGGSSFLPIINDMVAWKAVATFVYHSIFGSRVSKTNSASSNRTNLCEWTCKCMSATVKVCNLKVPGFHCQRVDSVSGWGTEILQAARCGKKKDRKLISDL